MTTAETPERFIRRFLDTYEEHDFDRLWTFYSTDCRFPVLERFGIEPSWERYKIFMETFTDAFPDVHHTIEKLLTDGDNIWALYTMMGRPRIVARCAVFSPQGSRFVTPSWRCIGSRRDSLPKPTSCPMISA